MRQLRSGSGDLTMRNLDIADSRDKLQLYGQVGLMPQALPGESGPSDAEGGNL